MSDQSTPCPSDAQRPEKLQLVLTMAGAVSAGAYTIGALDFLFEALTEWEKAYAASPTTVPKPNVELKVVVGASAGGMCAAMFALRNVQQWETFKHQIELNGSLEKITAESIDSDSENTPKSVEICKPITYKPEDWDYTKRDITNLGYKAWVQTVDIDGLLETKDFDHDSNSSVVKSIFDCTLLDDIANQTFAPEGRDYVEGKKPAFIANELEFALTVSNNLGIPYFSEFNGLAKQGYHMRKHADFLRFLMTNDPPANINTAEKAVVDDFGRIILNRATFKSENKKLRSSWGLLKQTALATGAFPIGLAPRTIEGRVWKDINWRNTANSSEKVTVGDINYPSNTNQKLLRRTPDDLRLIINKTQPPEQKECVNLELQAVDNHYNRKPTGLDELQDDKPVLAVYTDGGMFNNEPFELGEKLLTDPQNNNLAIDPSEKGFWSTTIMIDPFPNMDAFNLEKFGTSGVNESELDLLSLPMKLITSMMKNGLYKEDLGYQLEDKRNFSRFMIAPQRRSIKQLVNGKWIEQAVADPERHSACSAVSAFGGFLDKRYRVHDYMLGRRNAQRFLSNVFTVSVIDGNGQKIVADGNPLFANHHLLYNDYKVENDLTDKDLLKQRKVQNHDSDLHGKLPIIPLYGTAKQEVPPMAWPIYDPTDDHWKSVNEKMYNRFKKLVIRYEKKHVGGNIQGNMLLKVLYILLKPLLINFAADKLTKVTRKQFHEGMMKYNGAD